MNESDAQRQIQALVDSNILVVVARVGESILYDVPECFKFPKNKEDCFIWEGVTKMFYKCDGVGKAYFFMCTRDILISSGRTSNNSNDDDDDDVDYSGLDMD